jgi:hypothetical protein
LDRENERAPTRVRQVSLEQLAFFSTEVSCLTPCSLAPELSAQNNSNSLGESTQPDTSLKTNVTPSASG